MMKTARQKLREQRKMAKPLMYTGMMMFPEVREKFKISLTAGVQKATLACVLKEIRITLAMADLDIIPGVPGYEYFKEAVWGLLLDSDGELTHMYSIYRYVARHLLMNDYRNVEEAMEYLATKPRNIDINLQYKYFGYENKSCVYEIQDLLHAVVKYMKSIKMQDMQLINDLVENQIRQENNVGIA